MSLPAHGNKRENAWTKVATTAVVISGRGMPNPMRSSPQPLPRSATNPPIRILQKATAPAPAPAPASGQRNKPITTIPRNQPTSGGQQRPPKKNGPNSTRVPRTPMASKQSSHADATAKAAPIASGPKLVKATSSTTPVPVPRPKPQSTAAATWHKLLRKPPDVVPCMDAHHSAAMSLFAPAAATPPGHATLDAREPESKSAQLQHVQPVFRKGRQRIRPRTKKFTALKKKVLEERLRKWNESQVTAPTETTSHETTLHAPTTVCLWGFCNAQELDDVDEYDEILDNLRDMATQLNEAPTVFLPRTLPPEYESLMDAWPAWVHWTDFRAVEAAVASWNGLVVGGQGLTCHSVTVSAVPTLDATQDAEWQSQCWATLRSPAPLGATASSDLVSNDHPTSTSFTIFVDHAITRDDLDDDESLAESLHDLRALFASYGTVQALDLARSDHAEPRVQVTFGTGDAQQVVDQLNAIVIGGQQFVATFHTVADPHFVRLHNLLTADTIECRECLKDVRALAQQFGHVTNVIVENVGKEGIVEQVVRINFSTMEEAQRALTGLDGTVIGGTNVSASGASIAPPIDEWYVRLCNVLTADDLEDDECLEESLNDVRELAKQFGHVTNVVVEAIDDGASIAATERVVRVDYSTLDEAKNAVTGLNETIIGGGKISASLGTVGRENLSTLSNEATRPPTVQPPKVPETMFSGDKIVSERFAECKRAPKIANAQAAPRPYATLTLLNETDAAAIKTLLVEMLGELMRLQKRAAEDKNAKARRRLVMGLREVARGVRAHKVKMVVMANNLDEYGIIDQTLQDIIELCQAEEVPIFYEFTKRALGKALGKTIKVSVAGIQTADGADQQYKALMKYATKF